MNLSQQVTSLELSKKLKELGVKQDSLYAWEKDCERADTEWSISSSDWHDIETGEWGDCHYLENAVNFSAFTVAELGEMLPAKVNGFHIRYEKTVPEYGFFRWSITYWEIGREDEQRFEGRYSDIGEADARAKMLIYLIENHLITL